MNCGAFEFFRNLHKNRYSGIIYASTSGLIDTNWIDREE